MLAQRAVQTSYVKFYCMRSFFNLCLHSIAIVFYCFMAEYSSRRFAINLNPGAILADKSTKNTLNPTTNWPACHHSSPAVRGTPACRNPSRMRPKHTHALTRGRLPRPGTRYKHTPTEAAAFFARRRTCLFMLSAPEVKHNPASHHAAIFMCTRVGRCGEATRGPMGNQWRTNG